MITYVITEEMVGGPDEVAPEDLKSIADAIERRVIDDYDIEVRVASRGESGGVFDVRGNPVPLSEEEEIALDDAFEAAKDEVWG